MKKFLTILSLSLFLLTQNSGYSQKSLADSSITFGLISLTYSGTLPGGDLDERFGYTNLIGGEIGVKFHNNFFLSGGPKFLFGNRVKEYVAANVTYLLGDPAGEYQIAVIGNDGLFKEVRFFERGIVIPVTAGYIFGGLFGANPNSGPYIEAGGQWMQHKVRIEVIGDAPSLAADMRKGYDRLTQGFGATEGIGYRYYSNNRLLNFQVGLTFSQNFTKGRRDIQYDTGEPYTGSRLDMLYGIKVGWSWLIYNQAPDRIYYY